MRNRCKAEAYPSVAETIGRNYDRLRALCLQHHPGHEDIFHDTVVFVIHDKEALGCGDDEALIHHFLYRYRMIRFQATQDTTRAKKVPYGEYMKFLANNEKMEQEREKGIGVPD